MGVTTRDIAREAGVSQSTVSIVLNNNTKFSISPETRALVLRTAERMGYQFKKRAKAVEGELVVGLLVPTLSNLYYPILAQNVEIYAQSLGITIVLQNTMRSEEGEIRSFRYLRSIGVEGVLSLFTPKVPIPEDIPTVIIGEKNPTVDVDTVCLNSFTAGQMATEHLLSLGHKDIAYISTPFVNMTEARKKRLEGIASCMKEAGFADRLRVLVSDNETETLESTYEFDYGAKMTRELLDKHPECTAIIAVNDMMAMGCISVLNQRGIRIPEDMAICGFDNLYLDCLLQPQLTSVDQMAFHGCKVGLSILQEKMKNSTLDEPPVYMEYKPRLYIRGTTVKE